MLTGGHNECNFDVDVGFSNDLQRQTGTVEFRLNSEEAIDKNHDKKANTVEIIYRLQILGRQTDPSAAIKTSTTLAAEEAAPSVRVDSNCFQLIENKTIDVPEGCVAVKLNTKRHEQKRSRGEDGLTEP
ncbi:hypothetical protein E3N88_34401 [Mikania micrantha]|uniref:Uncharacterized protein n=1 Tax=Mikania micrantha TaxID=192012 RepID=A0A5N6LYB0_9ASTR|nr:hypothetical protein E3N88_34401 [Mikania micrantha]